MGYAAAQTTIFRVVDAPAVTNACHPMELENGPTFHFLETWGKCQGKSRLRAHGSEDTGNASGNHAHMARMNMSVASSEELVPNRTRRMYFTMPLDHIP